jgi:serine/threonine protein kinase
VTPAPSSADPSFAHGLVGVTLDGRYRLDAVLGEGGMGAVFRATHLAMDRKVAVKLLKPHLTSDQAALQRFAREARVTRKVESPHAVEIFDFGVTLFGDYYMVLEYLDGRTVQRELDIDGPFAPARVVHVARQALHALGVAHDLGLIHRDVKPDNLLLMRVGADADYTKILDFGVAKLMQGAAAEQLALTAAGMVFGTPEFMSPEQACGQPLDGRSDLYSLAATMFVMLTGHGLFEGQTAIEWLTHHARTPAPRLAMVRPELAAYPELDDLLQRCLAKPREHRPATAHELAAMLARIEPTLRRPPGAAPVDAPASSSGPGPGLAHAPTPPGQPRASSSAQRAFHGSNYFRALAAAELATTGAVAAANPLVDTLTGAASSAELAPAPPRARRGVYVALAGVALAGVVATAFAVSTSRRAAPDASPTAIAAPTTKTEPPPAPVAAPVPPPAPVEAPAPVAPTPRPPAPARATANPVAEEHLRNAEQALHEDNPLRQLAEADLALRADPRGVRAKFLLADALLKSGDLDRGCAYLRAIKYLAAARTRAHAAGCPGD